MEKELTGRIKKPPKKKGPKTFIITVGTGGSGKSFMLDKLFGGALPAAFTLTNKDAYAHVDPDSIREDSPAFKEVLRNALQGGRALPKDLVANEDMVFKAPYEKFDEHTGEKVSHIRTSWLDLARDYIQNDVIFSYLFSPNFQSNAIYDSTCSEVQFCKELVDKAKKAGFERIVVLSVNVYLECSLFRAGESRASKTGRWVPEFIIRKAKKTSAKSAAELAAHVKKIFPKSWKILSTTPSKASSLDENKCNSKTLMKSEEVGLGSRTYTLDTR